jgi:hypothetical protein
MTFGNQSGSGASVEILWRRDKLERFGGDFA